MSRQLCFVLMPLGVGVDSAGTRIHYDAVYHQYILPALKKAGLEPVRAESKNGTPTKTDLESLWFCDYAIVDISIMQPPLFYSLGIRHALKPYKTILIYTGEPRFSVPGHQPPPLSYTVYPDGTWVNKPEEIKALARVLAQLKNQNQTDGPLFLLLDELPAPLLDHEKTDVFRKNTQYSPDHKEQLQIARPKGLPAVKEIASQWGDLKYLEAGILVDLLLSYRATNGYAEMIELVEKMPLPLARRLLVQEQLAFALNRNQQPEQAEAILEALLAQHGPSSETLALLGRIYKDRYENALKREELVAASVYLDRAIDLYLSGFQADWRDAFPGINAITLMDIRDPGDPRKKEILPIVTYAVRQKIAYGTPDYWDYATLVELAVLADLPEEAASYLTQCRARVREPWEPQTTARNLRLIREAREKRGLNTTWISELETQLTQ